MLVTQLDCVELCTDLPTFCFLSRFFSQMTDSFYFINISLIHGRRQAKHISNSPQLYEVRDILLVRTIIKHFYCLRKSYEVVLFYSAENKSYPDKMHRLFEKIWQRYFQNSLIQSIKEGESRVISVSIRPEGSIVRSLHPKQTKKIA